VAMKRYEKVFFSPMECFDSLLRQIEHEDILLVQRTGWLLTTQSFLLVGFFTVDLNKLLDISIHSFSYYSLIGELGIVSTIIIFLSILAAIKVFIELRSQMHVMVKNYPSLPMRKLPKKGVGTGLLAPIFLCLFILYIWILLTFDSWLYANVSIFFCIISTIFFIENVEGNKFGVYFAKSLKFFLPNTKRNFIYIICTIFLFFLIGSGFYDFYKFNTEMGLQESGRGSKNENTVEVRNLMVDVENLKNQVEQLQKSVSQHTAKREKHSYRK
jgi:hypothetical protein